MRKYFESISFNVKTLKEIDLVSMYDNVSRLCGNINSLVF